MNRLPALFPPAWLLLVALAAVVSPVLTVNATAQDSVVFTRNGTFFTPTEGDEIRTWEFNVSNDRVFDRAVVDMDVTHGGWYAAKPDGIHNLFYFTRRGNWRSDTIGYVNLRGPNNNILRQLTNLEMPQGEQSAKNDPFAAQAGQTYHVHFEYNCRTGLISTELTRNGNRVAYVQMPVTASEIQTVGGFYQFWIGLHDQFQESPTLGWNYANLRIELFDKNVGVAVPVTGGEYAFDEANGSTVTDASGNGYDGTLSGATRNGGVDGNGGLNFAGGSQRVELPAAALNGADDHSLSFWFRTTNSAHQTLISGANANNLKEYRLALIDDTTVRAHTGQAANDARTWTVPSVADGQWHHMALVRDSVHQNRPARGPLTVHAQNPRYFDDGSGRAVVLVGTNHGWEMQDTAWGSPYVMDWTEWLDHLERHHCNYIRLWRVESTIWSPGSNIIATPMPYQRTGPGVAKDGQPKFDVTKFSNAWFNRMRQRCIEAGKRGMYVCIMFFERHSSFDSKNGNEYPFGGHPFHPDNNINGIDGDVDNDGQGLEMHHLPGNGGRQNVYDLQKAYVEKVIDTVGDLDNVLFEICNEALPEATPWQLALLDHARQYMAGKPKQHLLGFTGPGVHPNGAFPDFSVQLNSSADFVSPRDNSAYRNNPPANDGSKVIFADSDHIDPYGRDAEWVWKCFTRGLHPSALEGWEIIAPNPPKIDPQRDQLVRDNLGHVLRYAEKMRLASMTPRNALASSAYCLASPGNEYLVFIPGGGAVTVDITAVNGDVAVEWLEVATGNVSSAGTAPGGAQRAFTPPFNGHAVLYLRRTNFTPTSSTLTLYLDGQKVSSQNATLTPLQIDDGGLIIGQTQGAVGGAFGQPFVGYLDNVTLHDRVLTDADVAAMYTPPAGGNQLPGIAGTPYVHSANAQFGSAGNPVADVDLSPRFSAIFTDPDAADTATQFFLQVSTDSTFATVTHWHSGVAALPAPVANGERCPDIEYAGSELSSGVRYYWRMIFIDEHGGWGEVDRTELSFTTTDGHAPSPPHTLFVSSKNAQIGGEGNPVADIDPSPVFSAVYEDRDAGDQATQVFLQVSTDATFASVTHWNSGVIALATPADVGARCTNIHYAGSPLATNTRYHWRMIFIDASGKWGEFQTVAASFTTNNGNHDPDVPIGLLVGSDSADNDNGVAGSAASPAGGIDLSPVFSAVFADANSNDSAISVRIQVSRNEAFTDLVWDSWITAGGQLALTSPCLVGDRCADIAYNGDALDLDQTYYWRLAFFDNSGAAGAASTTGAFFTGANPPGGGNGGGDGGSTGGCAVAGDGPAAANPANPLALLLALLTLLLIRRRTA